MARRILLAWAWVVSILAAAPSASAQLSVGRDLLPTRSALARLGLERNWMALVPVSGAERLLSISLAERMFFAQTNLGNFFAYDAESGRLLWSAHLTRRSATAQPVSVNSRLVFMTSSNELFGIDRGTGRIVFKVNLGILPTSATACDEQHVMVGLSNGKLVAFQLYDPADKKKTLYEHPRDAWNWQTLGGPLTSRPLPAQQFVAFGGQDGKLYVALADLPQDMIPVMLYRIGTGGPITAPLGAYGTRTVLVPSTDKNVYAVDLFGAEVKWTYPSGAPVTQQPMAADEGVYVTNTAPC